MTFAKEKADDAAATASSAGYQNARSDTESIKEDASNSKTHSHLEIARQPHMWRKSAYRMNLSASSLRVGFALVDRFLNRKTGRCDPSIETLAAECGLPIRTTRDGIEGLKRSGLLKTKKKGLRGTLSFTFCIPNVAEIQHTEHESQCGENSPDNVAEFRRGNGENSAINLRDEPPREPPNTEGSALGPSSLSADASGSIAHPSEEQSHATTDVEGEPRPFSEIDLDRPIERPALYPEQRDILIGRVGKDVDLLQRLLDIWAIKPLTERLIQQLREEDSARAAS